MNSSIGNRHGSAVFTLPSDIELLVTQEIDAPADLVFDAWTTPDLVKRWRATYRSADQGRLALGHDRQWGL